MVDPRIESRTASAARLAQQFETTFGSRPCIFSAPGRVNLIGEHTDYNDGFVMPCALDFSTKVAIARRHDRRLHIRSLQFPQPFVFDLDRMPETRIGAWPDYVLGVAAMLTQAGYPLAGADVLIDSDVPIGSGLSSSAALEVASARALLSLTAGTYPAHDLPKLCQRAENLFVGARVGIMDQFAACFAKAGHALLLDCRSLDFKLIELPQNVRLVICNTMVKHEHASGEYNQRRAECEAGVKILSRWHPGIRALRDLSLEQLQAHSNEIPAAIFKRCMHVVQENQRVLDAACCLADDVTRFKELLRASHRSLRDLYEVSCRELDIMVQLAEGLPGHLGGRMTGGGFGGCTVNLVEAAHATDFATRIAERYQQDTGIKPEIYLSAAADGALAGLDKDAE
ncbi:MAG TPA: galactokinase [Terriglobales bacterium]